MSVEDFREGDDSGQEPATVKISPEDQAAEDNAMWMPGPGDTDGMGGSPKTPARAEIEKVVPPEGSHPEFLVLGASKKEDYDHIPGVQASEVLFGGGVSKERAHRLTEIWKLGSPSPGESDEIARRQAALWAAIKEAAPNVTIDDDRAATRQNVAAGLGYLSGIKGENEEEPSEKEPEEAASNAPPRPPEKDSQDAAEHLDNGSHLPVEDKPDEEQSSHNHPDGGDKTGTARTERPEERRPDLSVAVTEEPSTPIHKPEKASPTNESQVTTSGRRPADSNGGFQLPFPLRTETAWAPRSDKYREENSLGSDQVRPAHDRRFDGPARLAHLKGENIQTKGFENPKQLKEAREQIAAIGYPLDHIKQLTRKENDKGRENVLASWGNGEFTIHDLHNKQIPEKRLATIGHESAHMCSPLKEENVAMYGGEEGRAVAREYLEKATQQAIVTGVHLNAYHKHILAGYKDTTARLEADLSNGTMDRATYHREKAEAERKIHEETWAILNEKALTDRAGLAQVQERQQRKMDDLNRAARAKGRSPVGEKVDLLSSGNKASGVDVHMITLLEGVNNLSDLRTRVTDLKRSFYPGGSYSKSREGRGITT